MSPALHPALRIARKEAGELVLGLRGQLWLAVTTAVLSGFSLLLVGSIELSLLDNAQVVYDMAGLVTALGALLALISGIDAIGGERERGSLLPLLLAPVRRDSILAGKLGGPVAAWGVMLALAAPYFWAVGSTGQNMLAGMAALLALGTPVVLGFGFLGVALGARMQSARTALSVALTGLVLSASPVLLGPSLRQSAIGRVFDAVNPFSAALNGFDAVIIDSQGAIAQAGHAAVATAWLAITAWWAAAAIRRLSN
ncbi:MAG: ABC transporter permease subunit [Rhodospirillales bacterium]|nr:ABC transporter permease subunit [Rhodospirillales bacterium]MDE2199364.1 ABC transporter permease subunit [Rhodospirillales bacterium]